MSEELIDSVEGVKEIRITYRPVILWSVFLLLGIVFKVQHWPGGSVLLLLTSSGMTAYCLSKVIMITKRENLVFLALAVLGIGWFGIVVWGALYNSGYPFNVNGIKFYAMGFALYFVLYLVLDQRRLKKYKTP